VFLWSISAHAAEKIFTMAVGREAPVVTRGRERILHDLQVAGAASTGVATSALRYWEELGLLPAPARVSGQRRYPPSAVGLVGVVLLL
jgi:hypothetical protein